MEASAPQPSSINLSAELSYQHVYTLTDPLRPPLHSSPAALRTRNHAAIAKVASLLPVNTDEGDRAAQCIAARAHIGEGLPLLRENAHDIALVIRPPPNTRRWCARRCPRRHT